MCRNDDFSVFENHTTGIGSKLLKKMGYEGKGLGINGQGIVNPIKVEGLPHQERLGYVRKEVGECTETTSEPPTTDDECWVYDQSPTLTRSGKDHGYIRMDTYLHWYEAFSSKAQKQIHEGLGPKWTISYHCGDMWCQESLQVVSEPSSKLAKWMNPPNAEQRW